VVRVAEALGMTPADLGLRVREPLRGKKLTTSERELVEELLSLPPDEQEVVREALAALRSRQGGK
jgi:hypothetical protein